MKSLLWQSRAAELGKQSLLEQLKTVIVIQKLDRIMNVHQLFSSLHLLLLSL